MSEYLKNINSPADLKKLSLEQLPDLAAEIRETLLTRLMATGGHAGPNLGMVRLRLHSITFLILPLINLSLMCPTSVMSIRY